MMVRSWTMHKPFWSTSSHHAADQCVFYQQLHVYTSFHGYYHCAIQQIWNTRSSIPCQTIFLWQHNNVSMTTQYHIIMTRWINLIYSVQYVEQRHKHLYKTKSSPIFHLFLSPTSIYLSKIYKSTTNFNFLIWNFNYKFYH